MSQPGPIVPGQGPQKGPAEREIEPNSEKFKQQMRQVGAVESTDPEQQTKKKQQMLGDEEEADDAQTAPPPVFSLNDTPTTTLLSGQAGTEAPMSADSEAPSSYVPVGVAPENDVSAPGFSLPPPVENDSDVPSTSSFEETDTTPEPIPSQKSLSPEASSKTPESSLSPSKTTTPTHKTAATKAQKGKTSKALKTQNAPLKPQSTSAKPTQAPVKAPKTPTAKGLGPEEPKEPSAAHVSTSGTAAKPKKSAKMDTEAGSETIQVSPQGISFPLDQAPPQPAQNPLGSYLSPEVHELFQTMVGLVIMKDLKTEGLEGTRMEVSLNNTDYESSPFYNLKIVITEYQTAPGRYNIELQGNAAQNTLLQKNVGNLFSSLNDPRYNLPFTVNRVDIAVKGEDKDFLFKRKESVKGGQKDMDDRPKQ